jgi:hypothetical protein
MSRRTPTSLHAGQVFDITFPAFTPRISVRSDRELTVEIIAGDNAGFSDTVVYEAVEIRKNLVMLSHVLDFDAANAYTAVTPAKGTFMRLTGSIVSPHQR